MLKQLSNLVHSKLNAEQRKVVANISWLASERVFRMAIGFVLLAWTARYLNVDQFGSLNYAVAFVTIFSPLFEIAGDQIIFRDLVNSPEDKDKILGTSFTIKTIVGSIVLVLSIGSILIFQENDPVVQSLVCIVSINSIFAGFSGIELWFQSKVELKYTISSRNIVFLILTCSRVYLLQTKAPIESFAWLIVAEVFLNTAGFIFVYKLSGENILRWRFDMRRAIKLVKVSFPLIFSTLSIVIYMKIDQVMLGQLADKETVGIYSAAVKLSEMWPFASTAIVKSVAPSIISSKKESEIIYYSKLQKLCNLQACLVYIIAVPMTFIATPFVVLVFGQQYSSAGIVLSIHIWSSMFLFLGYVKEIWISTEELTGFAFMFSSVGAVVNVVLNFVLIPAYKEVGAAIATVIAYGVADYLMCFIYPPARRFGGIMTQAMTLNLVKLKL